MPRPLTYEVYQDLTGEWRFRILAANGEIIATSEGYKNRGDTLATIKLICDNQTEARIRYLGHAS